MYAGLYICILVLACQSAQAALTHTQAIKLIIAHASDIEPKDKSDAKKIFDALGSFEFLLGMVIWNDILFAVNKVSKKLQSPAMCIDPTLKQIQGIIEYFEKYRNDGFSSSLTIDK